MAETEAEPAAAWEALGGGPKLGGPKLEAVRLGGGSLDAGMG